MPLQYLTQPRANSVIRIDANGLLRDKGLKGNVDIPVLKFRQLEGSFPSFLHHFMNSSVPN